jgi:hypothetical protein
LVLSRAFPVTVRIRNVREEKIVRFIDESRHMSQQVKIVLVSELARGPADETFQLALDGILYEIDLSTGDGAELRNGFRPPVESGREDSAAASARGRTRSAAAAESGREDARKTR